MNKQTFLDIAHLIDRWRIFPRLVLIGYGWFVWNVTFFVLNWYATQPKEARGFEESSVVGVVVTAVTGFAPWVFRIYTDSSQPWDTQPASATSTTVTQVTSPAVPPPAVTVRP